MIGKKLEEIYHSLYRHFGPQHWWPGRTRLEIIVGAVLTQNTNWNNVEKAIANLRGADALSVDSLVRMNHTRLAQLIRPAGYYNIKAGRLKNFMNWLVENFDGRLDELEQFGGEALRSELLQIKGIGPETADSIALYGFEKPVFVVDAYTARIATRHMLIEPQAGYEELRRLFQENLPQESKLFNEYHALLVRVGKEFCRPIAKCRGCPLEKLPHNPEAEQW